MTRRKPIVLAGAGDIASVKAAFSSGADAVYVGAKGWARWGRKIEVADSQIEECLALAHSFGRNLRVAMNIVPNAASLPFFMEQASFYHSIGVDALIVNDPGIVALLRCRFPELPLIVSVGCAALTVEDALLYQQLGASGVVLPLEADADDVRQLKEETELEVEVFVYGIREVIMLGKCWMSSYAQIKELPEALSAGKTSMWGSAKKGGSCYLICKSYWDLTENGRTVARLKMPYESYCVLSELPSLIKAGADTFKVQGRHLKPEALTQLVRLYRRLVDVWAEGQWEGDLRTREEEMTASALGHDLALWREALCKDNLS